MSQLVQSIISAAQAMPEGGLLSPKEFLHLASRAAVDQALTRLTREEKLLRVGRGVYALPVQGPFGARPPSTQTVVKAIEAASGEVVVPSGAAEANALGLTTQVPVREVFLTSGPSRMLRLGHQDVEFKHGMACLGSCLWANVQRAWLFVLWLGWGQSRPLRRSKSCIQIYRRPNGKPCVPLVLGCQAGWHVPSVRWLLSESWFALSGADQAEALEVAASRTGRPAHLLEKDIWVLWALSAIYGSTLAEKLTFKGGTSLSKVYKIIDRFSEAN
jgi:hypothetical protein